MGRPLPSELVDNDDKEILLGLPGAWADENNELADHYTTKIGGSPDWPVPLQDINADLLKCGVCGSYLGLVAQVYAPLTLYGSKIDERALYILGCASPSCGTNPASWRTIRFQKEVAHDETFFIDQTDSTGGSSASKFVDWWDENLWDGGYIEDGDDDEPGNMTLQDLQSSLLESGDFASAAPRHHEAHSSSQEATTSSQRGSVSDIPILPCFYVYTQSEGSTVDGSPVDDDDSAEFEETELVDAIEDPNDIVDGVGELWEEEEYEPEHSLSTDQTYLNFKKKLDLSPEQCFRYCFGGPPLWAMEAHDEPDKCGACGGPRVYEMQLMPPLLYFLQQASKDLPPSAYGPSEWSWFTLLVYSCAQSCMQGPGDRAVILGVQSDWSVTVEATILQAEASH
ncbi:unnamed protein product [Sphagnum balticum]